MATPIRIERTHTGAMGPAMVAWSAVDAGGAVTSGVTLGAQQLTSAQARALAALLTATADSADQLGAKVAALVG